MVGGPEGPRILVSRDTGTLIASHHTSTNKPINLVLNVPPANKNGKTANSSADNKPMQQKVKKIYLWQNDERQGDIQGSKEIVQVYCWSDYSPITPTTAITPTSSFWMMVLKLNLLFLVMTYNLSCTVWRHFFRRLPTIHSHLYSPPLTHKTIPLEEWRKRDNQIEKSTWQGWQCKGKDWDRVSLSRSHGCKKLCTPSGWSLWMITLDDYRLHISHDVSCPSSYHGESFFVPLFFYTTK